MSDKALGHAIYLSKLSGAEIFILNIIEVIDKYARSALVATMKGKQEQEGFEKRNRDFEITMEGEVNK
jgi:hypothetical protein